MAEGLPVDRYSPNTLEKIVDGVLELERGQERLLELEEEVLGVAVKEHVPQNDGEVHLAQGEEEAFGCVEGVSNCAKDILYKISCFLCTIVLERSPFLDLRCNASLLSVDPTVVWRRE